MKKTKKWLIYSVYLVAVTAFFLYMQFPSDAAKTYLTAQANAVDPFLRVSFSDVKPKLPLGLHIATVGVHWKKHLVFEADGVKVTPQYTSLIESDMSFRLSGTAYGGEVTSRLIIEKNKQIRLKIDLKNIPLEKLAGVSSSLQSGISGTCNAAVAYDSRKGKGGKTNARLTLLNATIPFAAISEYFQSIAFNRMEAEVVLDENRFQIKNCLLNSPQGSGRFRGMVLLGESQQNTMLNVTGSIKPNQVVLSSLKSMLPRDLFTQISSGKKELALSIRGTLGDPTVAFNES